MDAIPALALVDIIALAAIAIGGIQGFFRGLSGELARLVGALLAFLAGTLLHEPVGRWVSDHTRIEAQPAKVLAFIATVVIAIAIMILIRILLRKIIKLVFAEGFDKLAGVVAGLLRMGVLTCLFFIAMNMVPSEALNRRFGHESAFGSLVVRYVPLAEQALGERGFAPFAGKGGNGNP